MRLIARLTKNGTARFVSHLDILRLLQRAFRRASIPLGYSQGFNPHPLLSFATALSTGYTSDAEWIDVKLNGDMAEAEFISRVNAQMPDGFEFKEAYAVEEKLPSLTALLESAEYLITFDEATDAGELKRDVEGLLLSEIIVEKRTKGGMKQVDIRPQIISIDVEKQQGCAVMRVKGVLNTAGSLNIELLLGALKEHCGKEREYSVHRLGVEFIGGRSTPV